jgi:hypothetical protein
VLSDSVLSAPIALLLTSLLIASAALDGDKVLAQSKRKPTGSRGTQVKPPSAVVPDERDPYSDPEILAQLANDKLDELTEKEAPELMEALHKAQRINYQINNKPGCPVTITSAGVKGLRIDYSPSWFVNESSPFQLPVPSRRAPAVHRTCPLPQAHARPGFQE